MTIGDWLERAARRLAHAGIERPRAEGRLLLEAVMGLDAAAQLREPGRDVGEASAEHLEALLARRAAREPMAYVLGRRAFWTLDLAVGPGVLVPRPETETLIEAALATFPASAAPNVLDLGTGSGCLLLAFLHERPNATGVGVDSSADALAWAERNALALGLAERARFVVTNFGAAARLPPHPDPPPRGGRGRSSGGGVRSPAALPLPPTPSPLVGEGWGGGATFDLILTNPPYIPSAGIDSLAPEVRDHEPRAALDGGPDGLDAYRILAAVLPDLLAPAGIACIELGAGQAEAVTAIFAGRGLAAASVNPDLSSIPRCLVLEARSAQNASESIRPA